MTANFLIPNIVRLDMLALSNVIGTATGFFLKWNGEWYLISNWHVFAGRDPASGQSKHYSSAVPDSCRYTVLGLGVDKMEWSHYEVLLGSADDGSANWYQHPTMGQDCDIAAIKVDISTVGLAKDLLEASGHDHEMWVDLGHDLYLPGFPLGLSANGHMAIWKRASLASSLEFGHSLNHFFFVDTATREGMSGSPCFAISPGRYYAVDAKTKKFKIVENPICWRLLGVYSGRRNPNDGFEAQIGIVWRENLIFDILTARQIGTVRIR